MLLLSVGAPLQEPHCGSITGVGSLLDGMELLRAGEIRSVVVAVVVVAHCRG